MHIIKREWAACPCCNTVRRLYLISADRRTEEMNDFDAGKKTISGQNYGPQQIPPGFQTQGPAPGGGFQPAAPEKKENVIGGIIGAFLGSLIGVAVIVLLDQLGYVAAVSGIVMGFCALKGYELLGGKLSKLGVVISVIIVIVMIWVGTRASWALALQKEIYTEESFFTVFRHFDLAMDSLKAAGADLSMDFMKSLLMQYGFAALGAVSIVFRAFRSH